MSCEALAVDVSTPPSATTQTMRNERIDTWPILRIIQYTSSWRERFNDGCALAGSAPPAGFLTPEKGSDTNPERLEEPLCEAPRAAGGDEGPVRSSRRISA